MTHPFHPFRDQSFPFIVSKQLWGEDRATIQLPDGTPLSVPISWTDLRADDPYISVAGGRSQFRLEDLQALTRLIASRKELR
ncbi:MAG: DUF5372 family protein [Candidatus Binatia bacterium]